MKRNTIFILAAALIFQLFFVGCGPRGIRYNATLSNLNCSGKSAVAVAVLDERPYVLNREKDPSYSGTIRGGYGNPFDLWTESGGPLADDMTVTIASSLRTRGYAATLLNTVVGESQVSVLDKFGAAGSDRLVLVRIKEWRSDYLPKAYSSERSTISMKIDLTVFDKRRKAIAVKNLQEEMTLPSGWPEETVPIAYQKKIRQLLDDPQVCRSLP